MILSILLSLDPRGPEATIYIDRNGFGFSEEISFRIFKRTRIRLGPKRFPYNASCCLAKKFFNEIVGDANELDGHKLNVTNENYVAKVTGQGKSVHLEIGEEKSEKVLMFIKKFVKANNLTNNGKPAKHSYAEETFEPGPIEFSFQS